MQRLSRRKFLMSSLLAPALADGVRLHADGLPGLVETNLEASQAWLAIGGRPALLYAYNNRVPGSALEARPGEILRINFKNSLPEDTNLHFHGLHVPPIGNADNAFLMIPPGESYTYEVSIPVNHPAGTFWIHPHIHGKTARQVSRGLALPLLIRGDLDQIPAIGRAPESVLVLQDFNLDASGYPVEPLGPALIQGREGSLITTNGLVNPSIPITAGGLVRLHLVNASSSRFYLLQMEHHPLIQIASSGGGLASSRSLDQLLLAPGERVQVIITGSLAAGSYRLLALPYAQTGMGMMGSRTVSGAPATVLATLIYEGHETSPVGMPGSLVPVTRLPAPARVRTFVLGQGMGRGMGSMTSFTINGLTFDPTRVDTSVRLGDVEDWEFINASMMDHPMHIHTNPFQIVNGNGDAENAWRDIVTVPASGRVKIRMQFLDYIGKTFYHCHILDHEDLGMMAVLAINS